MQDEVVSKSWGWWQVNEEVQELHPQNVVGMWGSTWRRGLEDFVFPST